MSEGKSLRFLAYYLNGRRLAALANVLPSDTTHISLARNTGRRAAGMDRTWAIAKELIFSEKIPALIELATSRDLDGEGVLAHVFATFTFSGAAKAIHLEQAGKPIKNATLRSRLCLGAREYDVVGEMYNEHYYSDSSLRILSNKGRMLVVGLFRFNENSIDVSPYIIGELVEEVGVSWTPLHNVLRVYPDTIDVFSQIRSIEQISKADLAAMMAMPEDAVKRAFAEIIGEPFVPNDWGGERSDLSSNNVSIEGETASAAFIFKGPSLKGEMHPGNMGKRGDQLQRAFEEPVDLVVVQHCNKIANSVVRQAEMFATAKNSTPRRYCIIDGGDTARILKAYGYLDL